VKKSWIRGLAWSLGICTTANVAWAQDYGYAANPGLPVSQNLPYPPNGSLEQPGWGDPNLSSATPPVGGLGVPSYSLIGSGIPVSIPQPPAALPQPEALGGAASADAPNASSPLAAQFQIGADAACGDSCYAPCMAAPCPWFFGANALIFDRIDDGCIALTMNANDPSYPLLCGQLVDMPTSGGFELNGGRYFENGRYALMGNYWGVFSERQTATQNVYPGAVLTSALPFNVQSPLTGAISGLQTPSQLVADWFDGATLHQVQREQDFQSFELNFFSFALGGGARQPYQLGTGMGVTGPGAPWYGAQNSRHRLNLFTGLRWFQFQDYFGFAASENDYIVDGSADDFFYSNNVTNDLFGGQIGAQSLWTVSQRIHLFLGSTFGVFNNRMKMNSYAGTSTDPATVLSNNVFNGQAYSFSGEDNEVALLGEGNVGLGIRVTQGWTFNVGYRLIGVSGVATSIGQIPRDFSNLNDAWSLKNENSLLLQAVSIGAAYNF
jgi:hypothetical protein